MKHVNTNSAPYVPAVADSAGGFPSSRPSARLDYEPAAARETRLTGLARGRANWLADDLHQIRRVERLPHFANVRDGDLVEPKPWELQIRWSWIVGGAVIWAPIIWALT